ncbi:biotin--[acetyl-CoA-carboxylase] ligase [Syntrophotalea acetylenivorans]|uniref:Bifunctional ligase/repressor BirA n=1 Tax=Syntrophotalea acetylenivorans TaxID=1842532 RepID=A0A1L3GKU1_9BACT|nr:biotin--[acetyl-CoA-carboxylase] ligase [Syntrophotalea acetylenivorans]APG26573.1 biotin--[acetyl-CoA-carboxylase] ligase [Syntrophotalea acetylenivorans]
MSQQSRQDEILMLFRQQPDAFVSGAEMSRVLGVSRTAVWKHIEQLRTLGYQIEAVTARGYRLRTSPDLLLPAELQTGLQTKVVGRELVYFTDTDSTNDRAHDLAKNGAEEGTVVIAESQQAGKGRLGRRWTSPAGVNLYASIILRPPIAPRYASQLTFLSSAAVARAIVDITGLTPTVKWPNDVLLDGCKVAGLLNELDAETERIRYLVLGVGVNVNMKAEQFPDDLRYPASSLAIARGQEVSRLLFTRTLLEHLDQLYDQYRREGFQPILQAWQGFFALTGRQVEVDCQGRLLQGQVVGLDDDGALLLQMADGRQERVLAGDVRPL